MKTVTSKDGTRIAFDQEGSGPALILVSGAIQYRAFDQGSAQMIELLSPHFTVINYDRRGRGDSSDTQPFAVDREIEDIEALIDSVGGEAFLYGISSGAALAMEATIKLGSKVKKLAMYEAPYNAEQPARQAWAAYRTDLKKAVDEGRNGDAIILFMKLVGMSDDDVPGMRQSPIWPTFESVGHTLAYDAAALGDEADVPLSQAARVTVPALVMAGSASYPFMATSAIALAKTMPHGEYRSLEGQTHEVDSAVIAPVLKDFFLA